MAFRFPLATVLRVRESIEQREERALQRIQRDMARVVRQIEELNAAIVKARDLQDHALLLAIPAGHLHTMLWEAQAAVEGKKALLISLQILDQEREKQMKVYQAAHRDLESLTNMLNEQRSVYQLEQARTQQKYLDDIFMARRHRS
jgi:flagellar export protein FliJ